MMAIICVVNYHCIRCKIILRKLYFLENCVYTVKLKEKDYQIIYRREKYWNPY